MRWSQFIFILTRSKIMCRWLAYTGPKIFMDALMIKPRHSLIDQSLHAKMNFVPGIGKMTIICGIWPGRSDRISYGEVIVAPFRPE